MYQIRKAELSDLPRILGIYAYARDFMVKTGNPNQWGTTNPPKGQLQEDIAREKLYVVCRHNEIRGVFFFDIGEDPTYKMIYDGQWHASKEYGTIHRIASDGSGGILNACVAFCEKLCPYLRIDTHADNKVMQHALEKQGFHRCGIIYIADGSPRIAYDRI